MLYLNFQKFHKDLLLLSGYNVEKKKPNGDWEKVNSSTITDSKFTVPDLKEGDEYEFRVAAVNDAGEGDKSLATAPVKVYDKNGGFPLYIAIYLFLCGMLMMLPPLDYC